MATPKKTTAPQKSAAPRAAASKTAAPSRAAAPKAGPAQMGMSANVGAAKKAAPAAKGKYSFSDNDLKTIMVDSLQDIYYAEKQVHKALGKMAKNAYNPSLKAAFLKHQAETEGQIRKVEEVFGMLGEKVKAKKCPAMDGLIKEGNEHMDEYSKGPGRDAAMIEGAQKVEHYEMAAYGTMRTFAQVLGLPKVAGALQSILDQEGAADKKLTELAETVNVEALRAYREASKED